VSPFFAACWYGKCVEGRHDKCVEGRHGKCLKEIWSVERGGVISRIIFCVCILTCAHCWTLTSWSQCYRLNLPVLPLSPSINSPLCTSPSKPWISPESLGTGNCWILVTACHQATPSIPSCWQFGSVYGQFIGAWCLWILYKSKLSYLAIKLLVSKQSNNEQSLPPKPFDPWICNSRQTLSLPSSGLACGCLDLRFHRILN
jgi:hypothetical protein